MPALEHNLGMDPADERVVDEEIAAFEAANFKRFVEAEITPGTGAHLCSDLHSRRSPLVCLGHGCHSGYYTKSPAYGLAWRCRSPLMTATYLASSSNTIRLISGVGISPGT